MRSPFLFILFLFSILCTTQVIGQDLKSQYDKVYNMDPDLYNGIIFTNIYNRSVVGTQFFEENTFRRNDLTLGTRTFNDQYINYDVYHQKLLLTFIDESHAQKMVEIPTENIRHFYIGESYFEVLKNNEGDYKFYQVYNFNESKLLVYWIKYMKSNSTTVKNSYRFTDMRKQLWLLQDGDYTRVKNNKAFISTLPESKQSTVQTWLKENKIKIQKADHTNLQLLTAFLDSI